MDKNKKKPTLREAYDAACKGEEYARLLVKAKQAVNVIEAKIVFATAVVVLIGVIIAKPLIPNEVNVVETLIVVFIILGAAGAFGAFAWRMLRGNVLEKMYDDLDNQPADQDGTKRTEEERRLLASSIGTAHALVLRVRQNLDRTTTDFARAKALSTDDYINTTTGNALANAERQLRRLEVDLELVWQRPDRDTALVAVDLGRRCQNIAEHIDSRYEFIYHWALKPA